MCTCTSVFLGILVILLLVRLWHWLQARKTISSLHTRHVLITGCDTGFGRRLALRLDKLGLRVFAACLTSSGAKELSSETSDRVTTILMDVTKDEDIEKAVEEVKEHLPKEKGLWAIVNNAGIMGPCGTAEMLTRRDFLQTLQVNLLGLSQVTRMFLPLVRRERGRIINTTSVVGRFALSPTPYVASKFAAVGYTDMLRRELYHQGISVHSIEPGAYDTNLLENDTFRKSLTRVFENASPYVQQVYGADYVDKTAEVLPRMKRIGLIASNPEEVVDAYVHALTSKRPSISYVVGRNGNYFYKPLWNLPTALADWIVTRGNKPSQNVS